MPHAAHAHAPAAPLSAHRSGPLSGRVRPPGDKSVSHRALIFGLLAIGETKIEGLLEGEDVLRTAQACRQLGAKILRHADGRWSVWGAGLGSLLQPTETLDFGNAGTGSRLMMGVVAGHPILARFDGDASLRKRPMKRILDPLALQGAQVLEQAEGGRLPLVLQGSSEPLPVEYKTPVASAQIKSAVLLCGLNSPGQTTVIEAEASRDHTEKMLAHFGAKVVSEPHGPHGRKITLEGRPEMTAREVRVPADPSSAAFPLVAALIVEGSDIVIEGVMTNPLRSGLLTTLQEMGADVALREQARGGRRRGRRHSRALLASCRRRRAGGAGALNDRRISDPRRRGLFRQGRDADARALRIAGEGIGSSRGGRRRAQSQWRRLRDHR